MSLTSHMNDLSSPARQFMERTFPNHRQIQKSVRPTIVQFSLNTIYPSPAVPHGTIGTALDYRIRYYLENTTGIRSIAFMGARALHGDFTYYYKQLIGTSTRQDQEAAERLSRSMLPSRHAGGLAAARFFANLSKSIGKIKPAGRRLSLVTEQNLCRQCIVLALYEELMRARMIATLNSPIRQLQKYTLTNLLAIAEDSWIDDMCALSASFYDNFSYLLNCETKILNPVFGGLGGADGDLILDGCLIEIKTTISPRLDKVWLYQLLGYVLLDTDNKFQIRSVAILYARQGFMLSWELNDLLSVLCKDGSAKDLTTLRESFNQVCENLPVETRLIDFNQP